MAMQSLPLSGHVRFRTSKIADLSEILESELRAQCVCLDAGGLADSSASYFRLPAGALWFYDWKVPITLRFAEDDYLRVQIQWAGSGVTLVGETAVAVDSSQSCISDAAATIEFGAGFQQLDWRIPRDALVRTFAALTGSAVSTRLEFEAVCNRDTPQSKGFEAILDGLVKFIDCVPGDSGQSVRAELEESLMVSMLTGFSHNLRAQIDGPARSAAPWQVRRVEDYIAAHWDKSLDIGSIVAITGVSARSIFRAFRKSRGYSPMEFARQKRLLHAREMLQGKSPPTVRSVALACGFHDVSQFSRSFSRAFGEPPSAVVRRKIVK
jgi:AraC-like DNA-binding protein